MTRREEFRAELLRLLSQAHAVATEWRDVVLRDVEDRLGAYGRPEELEDAPEYQELVGTLDQIEDAWLGVRQAETWPRPH